LTLRSVVKLNLTSSLEALLRHSGAQTVLCRGRAIAAQLPHSPAGPVWVRHPHTRLQTGLAHIQRRDPLHHQTAVAPVRPRQLCAGSPPKSIPLHLVAPASS
jgi:hypothetical protein